MSTTIVHIHYTTSVRQSRYGAGLRKPLRHQSSIHPAFRPCSVSNSGNNVRDASDRLLAIPILKYHEWCGDSYIATTSQPHHHRKSLTSTDEVCIIYLLVTRKAKCASIIDANNEVRFVGIFHVTLIHFPGESRPETVPRWCATDASSSSSLAGPHRCFPVCARLSMRYRSINLCIQRRSIFRSSSCPDLGLIVFILYASFVLLRRCSMAKASSVEILNLTSRLRNISNSSRTSMCRALTHADVFLPRPIRALRRVRWRPTFGTLINEVVWWTCRLVSSSAG